MENTNYFGRICRFLGRIILFAGFILGIGIGALLIVNPFANESSSKTVADLTGVNTNPDAAATSALSWSIADALSQNQFFAWITTGAIILAALIALAYLARRYNDTIRKVIANIAKRTKSPIHIIELGLTLIVWLLVLLMLFFSFPVASTILIFPFIINELLFLFGWISYGMPDYKV